MSAQSDIKALMRAGLSQREIGRLVGRDSSYISQVSRGKKPGTGLEPSLKALRGTVGKSRGSEAVSRAREAVVPEPVRRVNRKGALARTRKPITIRGKSGTWGSGQVRRQAARSGGSGLAHSIFDAADRGQMVAATVNVLPPIKVNDSSGGSVHTIPGRGRNVTIQLGTGEDVLGEIADEGFVMPDGHFDVTGYVLWRMAAVGLISWPENTNPSEHVDGIEIRTY